MEISWISIAALEQQVTRLTEALDFFLCRSVEYYKHKYQRPLGDPREVLARDTLEKLGLKRS